MAKLKIYHFPDVILSQKAQPIERVDKSLFPLVDDMLETMYDASGVGLAANQVGLLKRLLVLDIDYEPQQDEHSVVLHRKPVVMINPVLIAREGSYVFQEGCLSVPEFRAEVKRSKKIKVAYQDLNGLSHTLAAEDYLAVVIQHEMDHLKGTLFIDHLGSLRRDSIQKKLRQAQLLKAVNHQKDSL